MKVKIVFIGVLGLLSLCAHAVVPALEREVSVRAANTPVGEVLNEISQQAGVKFSYNPSRVTVSKSVSLSLFRKPIRTVLNILFKGAVHYKQKGNYIILMAVQPTATQVPVKKVSISGYVRDAGGNRLADASVFDKRDQLATITNTFGYFTMEVPANQFPVQVKVIKEDFTDTVVWIRNAETDMEIVLAQRPVYTATVVQDSSRNAAPEMAMQLPDTAVKKKKLNPLEQFLLSAKLKASLRNISDTVFSRVQFSFLPFLSTNHLLSGNTVNRVSVNVLAGYSQGVTLAEVGGLVNVDRGEVSYFQAAGLANVVGGNVKGMQVAGLVNLNMKNAEGFQAAGWVHATLGHTKGFQTAGLICYGKRIDGAQAAGLVGLAKRVEGFQTAGLVNAADTVIGAQVGGLVSYASYIKGYQVSGLVNSALAVEGGQCAGLVNVAGRVRGSQVSFINIADTCAGVPFGFFSFVRKGYHRLELAGDEVMPAQVAFRTGVPLLHNIFSVGYNPISFSTPVISFGYGLGTSAAVSKRWAFTADLIAQSIIKDNQFNNAPLLTSLFAGMEWKAGKKFSVSAGPTFRMLMSYTKSADSVALASQLAPYTFSDYTFAIGTNVKTWAGAKVALRFL